MQCFVVNNEKIIGNRIDPYYYSPSNICDIAKKTIFEVLELSEIAKLQRGKFSHRPRNDPKFFNGSYPFIQTGDIVKSSQNDLPIGYSQTLNDLGLSVSKLFSEKTILITIAANIGDTAILNYPACFPDSVVAITPKKEFIKLEYLNIYLRFLKNYLNNLAPQAAQKNINLEQLSPTPIVIPPIKIQEQIIAIVDKAHNSKKTMEDEAERLLGGIDDYVLGELGIKIPAIEREKCFVVRSEEVRGKRIDSFYHKQFFRDLGQSILQSKYQIQPLGNIYKKFRTGTTPNQKLNPFVNTGIPFLRNGNLSKNQITLADIKYIKEELGNSLTYSNKNDLIVCIAGTIGICAVNELANKISINQNISAIEFKEAINPFYVSNFLNTRYIRNMFDRNSSVATIKYINNDNLKSLLIPTPPLKIQDKIASEVKARTQKAEQLKEEAKSLLQKAKDEVEKMILGN